MDEKGKFVGGEEAGKGNDYGAGLKDAEVARDPFRPVSHAQGDWIARADPLSAKAGADTVRERIQFGVGDYPVAFAHRRPVRKITRCPGQVRRHIHDGPHKR
jgi:hypothetical protein